MVEHLNVAVSPDVLERDGLRLLHRAIVGDPAPAGKLLELSYRPRGVLTWHEIPIWTDDFTTLQRAVDEWADQGDIKLGLTIRDPGDLVPIESRCVWADLMGKRSGRLLGAMERPATVVLRYGTTTHRVAVWALEQAVGPDECEYANRRLAFELEAPKLSTTPDFMALPPGGLFRRPRAIPEPVTVSRAVLRRYHLDDVVDGLPTAPKHA
jgi:hypothetical protein